MGAGQESASSVRPSASTMSPPPPLEPLAPLWVSSRDGKRRVSFPPKRLWSWAEVSRFELSFPLEVTAERARSTRASLTTLEATFSLKRLERLLHARFLKTGEAHQPSVAQDQESVSSSFPELHLKVLGQQLICWGVHQPSEGRPTPFYLEAALHPSPQSVRVDLFRGWLFGRSKVTSSLLAAELLRAAQLPALPSHPSALQIDPLTELSLALCLERGWKLPSRETYLTTRAHSSAHLSLVVGEGAQPYKPSGPYAEHLKRLKRVSEGEQMIFRGEHAAALSFYMNLDTSPFSLTRVAELTRSHALSYEQRAEARAWLEAQLHTDDHLALLERSWRLEERGDEVGAAQALEAWWPLAAAQPEEHLARDIQTLRGVAAYSRALLLERHDPTRALAAFEEARLALPQSLGVLSGTARLALRLSQASLADERLSEQAQLLEEEGRSREAAWAWSQVAEVRRLNPNTQDPLAAERAFSHALELDALLVSAHQGLAALAEERGDRALACERLDHALRLLPNEGPARAAIEELRERLDHLSRPVAPLTTPSLAVTPLKQVDSVNSAHPPAAEVISELTPDFVPSSSAPQEPMKEPVKEPVKESVKEPVSYPTHSAPQRRPKAPMPTPPRVGQASLVSALEAREAALSLTQPQATRPALPSEGEASTGEMSTGEGSIGEGSLDDGPFTPASLPTPLPTRPPAQPLTLSPRPSERSHPTLSPQPSLSQKLTPSISAQPVVVSPSPHPQRSPLSQEQLEVEELDVEELEEIEEVDAEELEELEVKELDHNEGPHPHAEDSMIGDFLHVDYPPHSEPSPSAQPLSAPPHSKSYEVGLSDPSALPSTPPQIAPEPFDEREAQGEVELLDIDEVSASLLKIEPWAEGLPPSMSRSAEPGPLMGELLEAEPLSEQPRHGTLSALITEAQADQEGELSAPQLGEIDVWESDGLWEAQPSLPSPPSEVASPSVNPSAEPPSLAPSQLVEFTELTELTHLKQSYAHLEGEARWEAALDVARRSRDESLELEEAERFFWEVIRATPPGHELAKEASEELGELLTASQDITGMLALYQEQLKQRLKPAAELHRLRAVTLRALGQLDEALSALDASEASGAEPAVDLKVALLKELGHTEEAIAVLDAVAESYEGSPRLNARRARAVYLSQAATLLTPIDPQGALERLRGAYECDPQRARLEAWHARAEQTGEVEERVEATRALVALMTEEGAEARLRARLLSKLAEDMLERDPLNALHLSQEALSIYPDDIDLAERLIELALKFEALEPLVLALNIVIPHSLEGEFKGSLTLRLAFALAAQGEGERALESLELALEELNKEKEGFEELDELSEVLSWGRAMCSEARWAPLAERISESVLALLPAQ